MKDMHLNAMIILLCLGMLQNSMSPDWSIRLLKSLADFNCLLLFLFEQFKFLLKYFCKIIYRNRLRKKINIAGINAGINKKWVLTTEIIINIAYIYFR